MTITLNPALSPVLSSERDLVLLMGIATLSAFVGLRRAHVSTALNLDNCLQGLVTGAFVIAVVALDGLRRCGAGST
jgi:hypothetical protein